MAEDGYLNVHNSSLTGKLNLRNISGPYSSRPFIFWVGGCKIFMACLFSLEPQRASGAEASDTDDVEYYSMWGCSTFFVSFSFFLQWILEAQQNMERTKDRVPFVQIMTRTNARWGGVLPGNQNQVNNVISGKNCPSLRSWFVFVGITLISGAYLQHCECIGMWPLLVDVLHHTWAVFFGRGSHASPI